METVILGWYVMVETGSVLWLTAFGSLLLLGTLVSPMFGVLGDRLGTRVMLVSMRAIYASLAAFVLALTLTGNLTPSWVLVVAPLARRRVGGGPRRRAGSVATPRAQGRPPVRPEDAGAPGDDVARVSDQPHRLPDLERPAALRRQADLSRGRDGARVARRQLRARQPPRVDRHGRDGRATPTRAVRARLHRDLVRDPVRLRPSPGHGPGPGGAPRRRLRPEHRDDRDDRQSAQRLGRALPRPRDGRADARDLRHAPRPD